MRSPLGPFRPGRVIASAATLALGVTTVVATPALAGPAEAAPPDEPRLTGTTANEDDLPAAGDSRPYDDADGGDGGDGGDDQAEAEGEGEGEGEGDSQTASDGAAEAVGPEEGTESTTDEGAAGEPTAADGDSATQAPTGSEDSSEATLIPEVGLTAGDTSGLEWKQITFGQSTDLNFASGILPEKVGRNRVIASEPGTINGTIEIESRGGKLAPGHDGLTFYYVEVDPTQHNFVLEADVNLLQLGPEGGGNPSGQEGAGLMVRDVNGAPRQDPLLEGFEEVPAASNFAATVWLRNGVNAMTRTGVTEPWGTVGSVRTSQLLTKDASLNIGAGTGQLIHMRLERTDTEFIMSASYPFSSDPTKVYESRLEGADWVQEITKDSMTVGFFAARNATVEFTNASFSLSEAHTQARPVTPPPVVTPSFEFTMNATAGDVEVPFRARSNVPGTMTLSLDGTPLDGAYQLTAKQTLSALIELPAGTTAVTASFVPDGETTPIVKTQEVTVRPLGALEIIAAPDGHPDGLGTLESPLDINTAIDLVAVGGTVLLRGGVYEATSLRLTPAHSGMKDALKTLQPYEGEQVTLSGEGSSQLLFRLEADFWHIKGLTLTESSGNGMRVSGSDNIIEEVVFAFNHETGFQMSGGDDRDLWPARNLILHCESHDNMDPAEFNADGFAAKLGVGPGNEFRGNLSHHNIDDGFDFYNRTNEGANFPIRVIGNISYSNGKLSDGYNEQNVVGTGFKVGGEGLPVDHVLIGNLAFDNGLDGFSDNFNPGRFEITNNTSIDNRRFNYLFRTNPYFTPEEQGVFRNNLSLRTANVASHDDAISGDVNATNFLFDNGLVTNGEITLTVEDLAAQFVSLVEPTGYERDAEGAIVWGDYTRPLSTSVFATAGTDGTYVGALAPQAAPLVPVTVSLGAVDADGLLPSDATFEIDVTVDGAARPSVSGHAGDTLEIEDVTEGAEVFLTAVEPAPVVGGTWAGATWTQGVARAAGEAGVSVQFVASADDSAYSLTWTLEADEVEPTPGVTETPSPEGTGAPTPGAGGSGSLPSTGAGMELGLVAAVALLLLAAGGAAARRSRLVQRAQD